MFIHSFEHGVIRFVLNIINIYCDLSVLLTNKLKIWVTV